MKPTDVDAAPMPTQDDEAQRIVRCVAAYLDEADQARRTRLEQDQRNWDVYHLRQDYSHKQRGQSREFVPKQAQAVEQITQFVHQALVNLDRWFSVAPAPGNKRPLMEPHEVMLVLEAQLKHAKYFEHIQDSVKRGLLASLMTAKLGGCYERRSKFVAKPKLAEAGTPARSANMSWRLSAEIIRNEDYYPDPTGEGLYLVQESEMDTHVLAKLADDDPTWDAAAVRMALDDNLSVAADSDKSEEQAQDSAMGSFRRRVVLHEVWGTLLDETGHVLYTDCVAVVANRKWLVRRPTANPFWHGLKPFVSAPFLRVPGSVWHRALMDAPTYLNMAQNELFNLMIDAAMMAAFGIKQIRPHWLDSVEDIADGLGPNTTLKTNALCPPGQKVLERVDTGDLGQEVFNMYQIINSEQLNAAMTNEFRAGSSRVGRSDTATEVMEANNSITSMLNGITTTIEASKIRPELEMAWALCAQYFHEMDEAELEALLGERRTRELLAVPRSEFFAQVVEGYDFSVFGLSQTLTRQADFRKYAVLLQTAGGNPQLAESFQQEYSFARLMKEMVRSLGIREEAILADPEEQAMNQAAMGGAGPAGPDGMSQVPSAAGAEQGNSLSQSSPVPREDLDRGDGGMGF